MKYWIYVVLGWKGSKTMGSNKEAVWVGMITWDLDYVSKMLCPWMSIPPSFPWIGSVVPPGRGSCSNLTCMFSSCVCVGPQMLNICCPPFLCNSAPSMLISGLMKDDSSFIPSGCVSPILSYLICLSQHFLPAVTHIVKINVKSVFPGVTLYNHHRTSSAEASLLSFVTWISLSGTLNHE